MTDIDHEAIEKQILDNHAHLRETGGDPIPDCDVYYLTRMLHFTDNVLVIPMRFPVEQVVVSSDQRRVWYRDVFEAGEPDRSPLRFRPSVYSLEAAPHLLGRRFKDRARIDNQFVGTTSRYIGVGATATGDSKTKHIIVFAPFCWLFTPATLDGHGVTFRCGISVVGTMLAKPPSREAVET